MKICPRCGSNNVIIFDSDNDLCNDCGKWFPAVEDTIIVSNVPQPCPVCSKIPETPGKFKVCDACLEYVEKRVNRK